MPCSNIAVGGFGNDLATPINSDNTDLIEFMDCEFAPLNASGSLASVIVRKKRLEIIVQSLTLEETTDM